MKCKSIEALLSAYAAEELNAIQRWIVHRHVRQCNACCAELSSYQRTQAQVRTVLQGKSENRPHEAIWPQVQTRVEIVQKAQKRRGIQTVPTIWRKAILVLAGVFILLISLWIHHAKQAPDQEILKPVLPLVEDFHEPGVTMMTFETDDPTLSIVWFFKDEELNQEHTNGGV